MDAEAEATIFERLASLSAKQSALLISHLLLKWRNATCTARCLVLPLMLVGLVKAEVTVSNCVSVAFRRESGSLQYKRIYINRNSWSFTFCCCV